MGTANFKREQEKAVYVLPAYEVDWNSPDFIYDEVYSDSLFVYDTILEDLSNYIDEILFDYEDSYDYSLYLNTNNRDSIEKNIVEIIKYNNDILNELCYNNITISLNAGYYSHFNITYNVERDDRNDSLTNEIIDKIVDKLENLLSIYTRVFDDVDLIGEHIYFPVNNSKKTNEIEFNE